MKLIKLILPTLALLLASACVREIPPISCIEHPDFDCPTICCYEVIDTVMAGDSCIYDLELYFKYDPLVDSFLVVFPGPDTVGSYWIENDSIHQVDYDLLIECDSVYILHVIPLFPLMLCHSELEISLN